MITRMTQDERRRVAVILGVPPLLGHGVVALYYAKIVLGLPIEGGGLVLGPMVGFPVGMFGVVALSGAVLMAWQPTAQPVVGSLVVALCFDAFALMLGVATPWALAGLLLSLGSLGFLVTTLNLGLRSGSGF